MSLTTSEMTPADIAAVTGNGNRGNGFFGDGNGVWFLIILFLFVFLGWGNNGFGGGFAGNGSGAGVVDGYVLTSDFASVERKLDNVNNGLCNGFYAQNTTMLQGFAGVNQNMSSGFQAAELSRANQQAALMQTLFQMQMQSQECCCENRAAIAQVRYDMAQQGCDTRNVVQNSTRDLIDNQNQNARAILDALTAQRIEAKDAKIAEQNQQLFAAQLAASQATQSQYLVQTLRPCPTPAYITCNPWATQAAYGTCGTCA